MDQDLANPVAFDVPHYVLDGNFISFDVAFVLKNAAACLQLRCLGRRG
jgi:hypothetical protein